MQPNSKSGITAPEYDVLHTVLEAAPWSEEVEEMREWSGEYQELLRRGYILEQPHYKVGNEYKYPYLSDKGWNAVRTHLEEMRIVQLYQAQYMKTGDPNATQ